MVHVQGLFLICTLSASAEAAPERASEAVDASARELFGRLAAEPHRRLPQAPAGPVGPSGPDLLELHRYGDLAVMVDPDGAWLGEALAHAAQGDVNWVLGSVADRFYEDFEDDYEYLQVLMLRDLGVFFAFYQPMANDIRGIGYDSVTPSERFDLSRDTRIEGYIFMNYVGYWQENPASGRYVFNQELGHRWGSFINIDHEEIGNKELLGRDDAHWSFWYHTPNSPMEGNTWVDQGDGTWRTDHQASSTYSDLDLYLMGLIGPEEVDTQTLLQPVGAAADMDPGTTPIYFACVESGRGCRDLSTEAVAVEFSVDDVIAAEGERSPTADESPRRFRMATVVLVLLGDELTPEVLDGVNDVRRQFEKDWEEDVGGRADLDTSLGASTAPELFDYVEEDTGISQQISGGGYGGGAACGGDRAWLPGLVLAAFVWRRRPASRRRRREARDGAT